MKLVINKCFGGFGLSDAAIKRYNEVTAQTLTSCYDVERDDPALVQVVEELGAEANDGHSKIKVVEIPDGVEYEIVDYDGIEHIAEKHRTWG